MAIKTEKNDNTQFEYGRQQAPDRFPGEVATGPPDKAAGPEMMELSRMLTPEVWLEYATNRGEEHAVLSENTSVQAPEALAEKAAQAEPVELSRMRTPEVWPEYVTSPGPQLPPGLQVNIAQTSIYPPVIMPIYPTGVLMMPQAPVQLEEAPVPVQAASAQPQEALAPAQAVVAEPRPGVFRECTTQGTQLILFTESAAKLKSRERSLVSPRFHLDLNHAKGAPFIMKLKALNKGFRSSAGKGTIELSCEHSFDSETDGSLTYRFWVGFASQKKEPQMSFRQHDFAQNRTSQEEKIDFSEAIDDKGSFFTVALEVQSCKSEEPQFLDPPRTDALGNPAKHFSQGDEGQLVSTVSFSFSEEDQLEDEAEDQAGSLLEEQPQKASMHSPAILDEDCSTICSSHIAESVELGEPRRLERSLSNPEHKSIHRTVESVKGVRPTPTPLDRLATDPTHNRGIMSSPMKIDISNFLVSDQGLIFHDKPEPVHAEANEPDPEPMNDRTSSGDPAGLKRGASQVPDKQSSLSVEVARLQQLKHFEQQTWNGLPALPPPYGVLPVPQSYPTPQNDLDSFSYGVRHNWTNVCVRNLPNNMKRQRFLTFLQDKGCTGIDFLYVPHDFRRKCGKGFGFVNFTTVGSATEAFHLLGQFDDWESEGFLSKKTITVCWAKQHMQGLDNLIEFFRNSTVMHDTIDEEFKPLLLENGVPKNFPGPLKRLRKPQAQNESE
mmetsp:Transcript_26251/g.47787  ORF Transcript_26251/g.47787 Transcript_26251/m.47787 type:complete len:721 (-) Transcript_26251:86-2248(-)